LSDFLFKQTLINGVSCLLYLRKKCLGILVPGNIAKATNFPRLPSLPRYLQALVYQNKNNQDKTASNEREKEHKQEACSTAKL